MNNKRIFMEFYSSSAAGGEIFAIGVWNELTEEWDKDQSKWSTNPLDIIESYAEFSPVDLLLWRNRYADDQQKIEIDQYLDSLGV